MKTKLLCLFLALVLVFGSLAVLSSCKGKDDKKDDPNGQQENPGKKEEEEDPNACKKHVDKNGDGICDNCQKLISSKNNKDLAENWWEDITYPQTDLIFQLTKCSNKEELPSGCARFMAGEELTPGNDIDSMISERNTQCKNRTKTNVTYTYLDDVDENMWSKNIDKIFSAVQNRSSTTPDMFCNFLTDMLCTSLKGSFANLYSRAHGDNYMDIDADGYMGELMASLTLSLEKIYVIASDYFLDLIRAFFIVPVNRFMYDSIADDMIEDLNDDGEKNVDDLFVEVMNGDWTYDRLAAYADKIYSNDSGLAEKNLLDTVGFAMSDSSGLSPVGIVYTTSVVIIHKEYDEEKQDYRYYYPDTNQNLLDLTAALKKLFESRGIISVTANEGVSVGGISALTGIRSRFAQDKVLFGGIILLGSLEYQDYQNMKGEGRGFGILPVPLYHQYKTDDNGNVIKFAVNDAGEYETDRYGDYIEDPEGVPMKDEYLTQIHAVGRGGAIAFNTTKFTQCTAFLQYQSTHSTDIMNEWYDHELMYNVNDTSIKGNLEMLVFIRGQVRTSFDKLFEDAVGFFYESTDPSAVSSRWHTILGVGNNDKYYPNAAGPYKRTDMASIYDGLIQKKQGNLEKLVVEYDKLPA